MFNKFRFLAVALFAVVLAGFCVPTVARADAFGDAARLLSAAKAGDSNTISILVSGGADINYVDNTGMSIVCTALMNNDKSAAQLLQVYGADASKCDQQIKRYKTAASGDTGGGFWSGLSNPQNLTLAIGGAALIGGAVYLLASSFGGGGGGHNNGGGSATTCSPGATQTCTTSGGVGGVMTCGRDGTWGNCIVGGGNTNSNTWAPGVIPPGYSGSTDIDNWSSNTDLTDRILNFTYMKPFNYLSMMSGYNPLERGYLGQITLRQNNANRTPVNLAGLMFDYNFATGGRPVNVALITKDGVNATGSAVNGDIVWTDCYTGGTGVTNCAQPTNSTVAAKYFNLIRNMNDQSILGDDTFTENPAFDLSGFGTVFGDATDFESEIAKVVAGWNFGGLATGDWFGFIPNGQLTIYRTGGGKGVDTSKGANSDGIIGTVSSGSNEVVTGNTITVDGNVYTITLNDDGTFEADGVYGPFTGRKDGNYLYLDSGDEYFINAVGKIYQLKDIDVYNFRAMNDAATGSNRSAIDVIANASLMDESYDVSYATLSGFRALLTGLASQTDANKRGLFINLIDTYYDKDKTNTTENTPGQDANALFNNVRNNQTQTLIFSAGEFMPGYNLGAGQTLVQQEATFENYAPVLYPDLEHLFMTVVAVQNQIGTSGISNASDYSIATAGKLILSEYNFGYGDYKSRKCGMAGFGVDGIDPWCFASAGITGPMAVASMAGAFGVVKGAFGSYMTNQQLFILLALTADGAYLGTNPVTGNRWASETDLIGYLRNMYELPAEYAGVTDANYLNAFKDTFGYGLVNLERATRPGRNVFYYAGTASNPKIVADNNAYWRSAVAYSPSPVFARAATISVPVWDVLESEDGSMTLPRVWQNDFASPDTRRGLSLGDVLGDFATTNDTHETTNENGLSTSMKFSESNRATNLGGLSELSFGFATGDWQFGAEYKHKFADSGNGVLVGELSNPILSLASDAVASSAKYNFGNFRIAARAFGASITDENLMENDPAISGMYQPQRLGLMQGAESGVGYATKKFSIDFDAGMTHESNTILGAYSSGLLNMGGGDTVYIDSVASFAPTDDLKFTARATFANTTANPTGEVITGLSSLQSNAFSFGADWKNWSLTVAMPLAITRGSMQYATMDYDLVEADNGYALETNPYIANVNLAPQNREARFGLAYRVGLDENTDAALGFVYRINPDNTKEFGNESILMMKVRHTVGL